LNIITPSVNSDSGLIVLKMLNDDSFKISVPDRIGIFLLQNLFPLKTNFVKMYLNQVIPRVSKQYLLLVAALVWTFAGGLLLYRGFTINHPLPSHWKIEFFGCTIAGLLFFMLLFNRISAKHVLRIKNLPIENPVIFSFFNLKVT